MALPLSLLLSKSSSEILRTPRKDPTRLSCSMEICEGHASEPNLSGEVSNKPRFSPVP
ncbi:hypothetical protein CLF_107927, partial [Clonorchis sinensis]